MTAAPELRLVRLLQLVSPALPVGAYSYSQGLEAAIDAGLVHDAASTGRWIGDALDLTVATMDAPALVRLMRAWSTGDEDAVRHWNDLLLASRETAELRAETVQMGYSLARLVEALALGGGLRALDEVAFPTAYACAASRWHIETESAVLGYLWGWAENQVLAAVKALPLGQTEAQRLLVSIGERLPASAARALVLEDDALANFAPGLALLSSAHETQYSRLFRS